MADIVDDSELPKSTTASSASTPTPTTDNETAKLVGDEPPSAEIQAKVATYTVLDREGQSHQYSTLYSGPAAAPRTLVVFIRHFFCGSCKEYIEALSKAISPEFLFQLSTPTSVVVVGCGDPGLIDIYAKETGCQFPIYADPTRKLDEQLGLLSSLALGEKPEYIQKSMMQIVAESFWKTLRQLPSGLALKGGDSLQNGGEFLYEASPAGGEERRVAWCHRMQNTRDHTGVAALAKILERRV
ncbi:hypothetical protein BO82DRAFT_358724 [Aspergillus uvarum CBS 121591]|uniref:AhpC/TSA antioxidant enzyme-domain-containing protein n=1 Tax=Aspergillus uvarum CBS 121591 TaxID=1448315 RepID=A0A319DA94_9EURO|nr:hypothetical protein BO82DRAFT_358724 [Aspergillus uvarum CBS 121591]PYH76862.1 hypothetical protein BO82DRAFT_358724 [Aspergillus uvarum CBS 121591]